ncbi:uncharacterized protein K02A2.6-like [Corticium candelabrum]|uniref:uncharacterized protein K02A2.6-like n=1 Tax=Corticium candelabrum TaxID=121492 RepID=UPI002E26CFC1|nr:uncharacterized protein K02A2.6-like [Corticium candelabrum]
MRRVFSFHGIPRRLVTDNGPQVRSVEFQEFMKGNGVKHQLTPPYHPSSNGQAERAVQIFKRSMEARPKGRTIRHQISILLLQYRSTSNTSTRKTPSELLMKRVLRTRLSLVKPTVGGEIRDRQESQTEAASRNREILPGESVAVWNPRQDSRGRWLSVTVVQNLGPSNYLVNVNGQARYVHVDHILHRDIRSFPQDVHQEQASNTRDSTATLIPPQAGNYSEVSAEKTMSSTDSTREDSVPTTPSHPELTETQSEQTDNMPTKKPIEKSTERKSTISHKEQ